MTKETPVDRESDEIDASGVPTPSHRLACLPPAELQTLREVAEKAREVPRSRWTEELHAALTKLEEVSRG